METVRQTSTPYHGEDFCLIHGREHMRSTMGNPVPWCEACENTRAGAEPLASVATNREPRRKGRTASSILATGANIGQCPTCGMDCVEVDGMMVPDIVDRLADPGDSVTRADAATE